MRLGPMSSREEFENAVQEAYLLGWDNARSYPNHPKPTLEVLYLDHPKGGEAAAMRVEWSNVELTEILGPVGDG
jgi:hypothetical protein